jgi:RNA polymerase sigma-70 factor (sigma-E family)
LYAAHWRSLVRFGVLLLRDQGAAEEVVQDAFIAMHGRWGRLRDPDRALGYLRRSVVNGARSTMRHRGVVTRHAFSARPPDPEPSADSGVLTSERRAAVLGALDQLPGRQREVLVCRYFLDLSEAEIAETLGISRGAVKSHASRGSAALRATLADHWTQEDPS